jgi:hypothetical protein
MKLTILALLLLTAVTATAQVPEEQGRALGMYVTKMRLSKVTDAGLKAIPMGALVTLVEMADGKKYAIFRTTKLEVADLAQLSNKPEDIAAASAKKELAPGATPTFGGAMAPSARTDEQITVDENGSVVSRTKMTTITDGAGNSTTISQAASKKSAGDAAAKIAVAERMIVEQQTAIWQWEATKSQRQTVSGYEAKMKAMKDKLILMEAELARLKALARQ